MIARGTCDVTIDRGQGLETFSLQSPTSALYVPPYVWHQFHHFSPDIVLLGLSSINYSPDRSGYIEDYSEYLKMRDQMLKA